MSASTLYQSPSYLVPSVLSVPSVVQLRHLALLALVTLAIGCSRKSEPSAPDHSPTALVRIGSVTIEPADLKHLLTEKYSARTDPTTRDAALTELVRRAQMVQAALDAGLQSDPIVRAELGRLLEARLRETKLAPQIKVIADIPEARLRECYEAAGARYQSPEKRQVAVLWLNPGSDPQRVAQYEEKLNKAREWFFQQSDLTEHPEKGFSILSIDHSEHQASRLKNGIVGWIERAGGADSWRKAVAEIAFDLAPVGTVSPVVTRPEGIFLIRLTALKPATSIPFESVQTQLEQEERQRQRRELETRFEQDIESRHKAEYLTPPSM
ncbi:MAG: peptidyl-prolyl cis-trans isomerase [Lentisphaerae bacterium]|nr:peptidyl-prolyl cis-trans isomerase [Lentisphaerota bacterium]